jgi:ketopantoate reductase
MPALFLSQNGIAALDEAKAALAEVLGSEAEKVEIVRMVIFNPVEKKEKEGKVFIKYSLPIKIAFSEIENKNLKEIFSKANFKLAKFPKEQAKNIEFSKLFLNLLGMASASRELSVNEGFRDKEVFREEVGALKEYIKCVRAANGLFLNFPGYPVALLMALISNLPESFLSAFRNILGGVIGLSREGKAKDLDEIKYYNGAVVSLGNQLQIKTPFNEIIYKKGLEKLSPKPR